MELTKLQEKGLNIAIQRYKDKEKYTVISGYAGTGKSTLVKFIISALGQCGVNPEEDVCFCAYTGKATQVLAKKGNKNTLTLHKLLYDSFPRSDGTFFRKPKIDIGYHVIVVDEVSMAPKTLMDLLFSHGCYVICLGDPFQLPPVDKDQDNGLLAHPHIFLDEIMRQAAESEIIQLTMKIRGGDPIPEFKGNEVQVLPQESLNTGMLLWADQILCATNKTRISLNNQTRALLKRASSEPEDGDKVICLRNYWGQLSTQENDLINGTIGYLKNTFSTFFKVPYYMGGDSIPILNAEFIIDDEESFSALDMDKTMLITGEPYLDNKRKYRLSKNPRTRELVPYEFTYGYAITTHKAQGSEWERVLVLEEGFPYVKKEHARWLYTAVSRSSEKCVLLR